MQIDAALQSLWYGRNRAVYLLLPLSWLYRAVIVLRRLLYISGILPITRLPVPVIIVGNVTAGGTGKTPLIIWLCRYLVDRGFRPGLVCRGYRGQARHWPQQVRADSDPWMVGDEAVLLARRTGRPVAAAPRRAKAAAALLQHSDCNIILCDDGLQHLALQRDIEIAVLDGDRRFGNGFCLPAGPLREPPGRLDKIDLLVANGKAERHEYLMEYRYFPLRSLDDDREIALEELQGRPVHALAGIGNPGRFFSALRQAGLDIRKHVFPDHHVYKSAELRFDGDYPVVMTEKDAVKCIQFNMPDAWYLPIEAQPSDAFIHRLTSLVKEKLNGQETA